MGNSSNLPQAVGGGGKKYASVVIGTSTAGWKKEDCDYLCDGTNDQEEFNTAISTFDKTIGGSIFVLPGTYNITARITNRPGNEWDNAPVEIYGTPQTILKRYFNDVNQYQDNGLIRLTTASITSYCSVHDLCIDGNNGTYNSAYNRAINISYNGWVYNTYIFNTAKGINAGQYGAVYGNVLEDVTQEGIQAGPLTSVIGNTFNANGANAYGADSFGIYSPRFAVVIGNTISAEYKTGILVEDAAVCIGNHVDRFGQYGIKITIANSSLVAGNIVDTCGETDKEANTYQCYIDGTNTTYKNDGNLIIGNVFNQSKRYNSDTVSYPNNAYSIYITSGATNNLIACNNIYGKNYTNQGGSTNTFYNNKYN